MNLTTSLNSTPKTTRAKPAVIAAPPTPKKAPNGTSLRLNAFHLLIEASTFQGFSQPMPDNKQLKGLRDSVGKEWFLFWKEGTVYGLPRSAQPAIPFGNAIVLKTNEYLGLAILNAYASELIPRLLPKYEPI